MEKHVVQNIIDQIKLKWPDAYTYKSHGNLYSVGAPDLLCCIEGKFVAIEVKQPKTKTNIRDGQHKAIAEIKAAGGLAFVAWDIESLREGLEEIL